jgi:hypothetical protein
VTIDDRGQMRPAIAATGNMRHIHCPTVIAGGGLAAPARRTLWAGSVKCSRPRPLPRSAGATPDFSHSESMLPSRFRDGRLAFHGLAVGGPALDRILRWVIHRHLPAHYWTCLRGGINYEGAGYTCKCHWLMLEQSPT